MALMELAVDFGSSYITIYKRGEGIVLKEASVVVVSTHKKNAKSWNRETPRKTTSERRWETRVKFIPCAKASL